MLLELLIVFLFVCLFFSISLAGENTLLKIVQLNSISIYVWCVDLGFVWIPVPLTWISAYA